MTLQFSMPSIFVRDCWVPYLLVLEMVAEESMLGVTQASHDPAHIDAITGDNPSGDIAGIDR